MTTVWPELEVLLPRVQKPARYIGMEDGAVTPQHAPHKVAWLLTYPDTYEVGLPNQGLQILYELLNERDDAVAERSYCPWTDLASELRQHRVPLFSVDSHRPAADFDVLAFNLSAELVYTNVLECLDLAGVPLHAARRTDHDAVVVVGGHCAFNPEPLADFIDVAVLGDGEEVIGEMTEVMAAWKRAGKPAGSRERMLRELSPGRGRLRAEPLRVHLRRSPARRGDAALSPMCPPGSRSAPSPTWPIGPTRSNNSCRSPRWCTTGSTSRCSAAAPVAAASARPA